MRKKILFAPLWGIFALSLLSSCRTEDGAITQKQIEDKRFAVFIPKSQKPVNYANGFEFLMKRYDEIKKTNISGINNSIKKNLNASVTPLFQNKGSYVEFKVRSQIVTEQNGEKWVIYPKVENNQVIGLIMSTLKEKETLIAFDEIINSSEYYKQLLPLFQEAFNRYNRKKTSLALNASIKPMAIGGEGAEPGGGETGCGDDVQKCGNIEEVIVPGKPKQPVTPPTVPIGVSSCWDIANCPTDPGSDSGGGGAPFPNPSTTPNQEIINNLEKYPCAQKLLEKAPNLNSSFSELIKNIFKENDRVKVTFIPYPFEDPRDEGKFLEEKKTKDNEGNEILNFTIRLSEDVLKTSTQEYALSVMYHEFVHAYLTYEWRRLGTDTYIQKYPFLETYTVNGEVKFKFIAGDHQAFSPFISMIADAIQAYNPNFSRKLANNLAMGGLTNGVDEGVASRQNERESNKYASGTKCAKP
ncbi:hypothetical protein OZ666_09235 [Elizabethkingia sp. HX QKY]|uniref:hypothetical protein n=1 Tax=Elizabethkingia TaxID=308865 RepID=UPI002A24F129|nr:hypothetical protein [Elizabethkingia sp. HX QKY]MDX8571863.1 hypothetical protein [Elizabethkingia sp. HX QKY]